MGSNKANKYKYKHADDEECIDACKRYEEYLSKYKDPDEAFANLDRDVCGHCSKNSL